MNQPEVKLGVIVNVSPEHYIRLSRMAHSISMTIEQYLAAQVECFAAALGAMPELAAEETRASA